MRILAGDRDLRPREALTVGHDADVLAFGLQNGALFNVQFEKRVHLALAYFLFAAPADALQFIAEFLAVGIDAFIGPVLCVQPSETPDDSIAGA